MYLISKEFSFSASHHLPLVKKGHPCRRQHGHNYKVKVNLASPYLTGQGFVEDYHNFKVFKKIIDRFDHRDLNAFTGTPTAEWLACHFYNAFKKKNPLIYSVSVSETDKTWAVYYTEPTQ